MSGPLSTNFFSLKKSNLNAVRKKSGCRKKTAGPLRAIIAFTLRNTLCAKSLAIKSSGTQTDLEGRSSEIRSNCIQLIIEMMTAGAPEAS